MVCEQHEKCDFFIEYQKYDERKLALEGLARLYCCGPMQKNCIRKEVAAILGGLEKVPVNMMPDGQPIADTDTDNWPDEAKIALK